MPLDLTFVKTWCRIDASNQEPSPTAITVAMATPEAAGNVNAGAHRYLATFVTADGETQAGEVSAAVTVDDAAVNGQVSLSNIPIGGALVTARNLYRTEAGGSVFLLLGTIANNTATTYTDNVADADLGAQAPTTNTTSDPLLNVMIASAIALASHETGVDYNTEAMPAPVAQWCAAQVAHWYNEPSAAPDKSVSPSPFLAGLLDPYRTYA